MTDVQGRPGEPNQAHSGPSNTQLPRDVASAVYDAIRARYRELPVDDSPLPPEYELMKEFKATRASVRIALNQLATEGVLSRERRLGTAPRLNSVHMEVDNVRNAAAVRRGHFESACDRDERAGRRWSIRASEFVASRLKVAVGETVEVEDAVVYHNGSPFAARTRYFVEAALPDDGPRSYELNTESRLEECGFQIGRIVSTLEAITCDEDLAARIDYVPHAPILMRRTTYLDARDMPLVWTVFRMRGDRSVMHIEHSASNTDCGE